MTSPSTASPSTDTPPSSAEPPVEPAPRPPARRAGPLAVAQAVFWSFFGIRRRRDYAADVQSLTLPQVIIGGIVGALVVIASLIGLVMLVTSK